MSTLRDAAITYAEDDGFCVLALTPKSKIPFRGSSGFKAATDDLAAVRQVWTDHPDANIGIRTGVESMLWVLDFDGDEGATARASLELIAPLGGRVVKTGRGWQHWYSYDSETSPNRCATAIVPGVDVKSDGGYVVAPPSIHPSGAVYTVVEGDVDYAPSHVMDLIRRTMAHSIGEPRELTGPPDPVPYDAQLWSRYRKDLAGLDWDDRGEYIRAGLAIYDLGWGTKGFNLWRELASVSPAFDERDFVRDWNSFDNRNRPARRASIDDLCVIGLTNQIDHIDIDVGAIERAFEDRRKLEVAEARVDFDNARALRRAHQLDYDDLKSRPSRRWLVKGVLQRGAFSVLASRGGVGKSTLAMHLIHTIATGRPEWLGFRAKAGRVVFLAAEDSDAARDQLDALERTHGQPGDADKLRQNLVVFDAVGSKRFEPRSPDFRLMVDDIVEYLGPLDQPSLLVVDHVRKVMSAELDINNGQGFIAIDEAVREILARAPECAVLLLAHKNKSGTLSGNHSLQDLARCVLSLDPIVDGVQLSVEKLNGARMWPDRLIDVGTATVGTDEDGDPIESGVVLGHTVGELATGGTGRKGGGQGATPEKVPPESYTGQRRAVWKWCLEHEGDERNSAISTDRRIAGMSRQRFNKHLAAMELDGILDRFDIDSGVYEGKPWFRLKVPPTPIAS